VTERNTAGKEPIAIIGMACVYPEAADLKAFWTNILECVDAIGEPQASWEAERYLESGRISTPYGGYLKDLFQFDPREFGIMPTSVDGGEPDQFIALRVARDALKDAGYLDDNYDHTDTGIVLGHSTYLHRGQGNHIQHHIILDQTLELIETVAPSLSSEQLGEVRELLKAKLPPSNADIAPGLVPNVMTGRIANRLNLKGPNYILDAACSSSLLAVGAAIDELRNGRSKMMIAGGVNASLPADVSVIFTQLGALSKRGKVRPFEKGSDGTLLGEGLGSVVLKRLSDAQADGDRIYAVIRGIGQASDGKGHGLLAPSVEGEALAIQRAYDDSGVDPSTIGLIEAHGTGIPLGDQTEIAALKTLLGERLADQGSVALGSVKSMISHCIPAAGIAGLIKTSLALHHKILPPTLCEEVNPELGIEKTPLYVNTSVRPWLTSPNSPRRAGVNSFGFGGINTHAILEEAPVNAATPKLFSNWPSELFVFSANTREELIAKLEQVQTTLSHELYSLSDIANTLFQQDTAAKMRLCITSKDATDLDKKLSQAIKRLGKAKERWSTRNGIVFSADPIEGKLAFIFPGEGSQYLSMLEELALFFPEVRAWFDFWRGLYPDTPGNTRTDIVFPPSSELTKERQSQLETRLHDMDVGSEAVFVGGQAMNALLQAFAVKPDVMLGHSSGESSALVASGAMANNDLALLADFIRELNSVYKSVLEEGGIKTGVLLTVGALSQEVIEAKIAEQQEKVYVAMDNCSNQKVLFGSELAIANLQKSLSDEGGICIPLPFDRGYHTPAFASVSEAFLKYYAQVDLSAPDLPLYSCASAGTFPSDKEEVQALAARQWSETVRFSQTIQAMHNDDVRFFVEVGPSGNLTSFVNDVLVGQEHLSIASDVRKKSSLEQVQNLFAQLYINKKTVDLSKLFTDRDLNLIDLVQPPIAQNKGMVLSNTMPVLRLNDEDKQRLRDLMPQPLQANRDATNNVEEDVSLDLRGAQPDPIAEVKQDKVQEPTAISPIEHQEASNISVPEESALVMSEYFGLMRDFISSQEKVVSSAVEHSPDTLEYESDNIENDYPFITDVLENNGTSLVASCYLNVYEDRFLQDHILSGDVSRDDPELFGLSCVPLMVSVEIMAEAVALLAGNRNIRVIENVKANDWIALDFREETLHVTSQLIDAEKNRFRAEVYNQNSLVISAEFAFDDLIVQQSLAPLSSPKLYRWPDNELYSTGMFHGPIFQSIQGISGWNEEGIDANLSSVSLNGFFLDQEKADLVLNPVLLDALGQLAAYWIAQQVGTDFNSFPSGIGRVEIFKDCPNDIENLRLLGRQKPLDSNASGVDAPRSWQFDCIDQSGQLLLRATDLVNIFFPVPHEFYQVRRAPLNGWLGNGSVADEGDVLLWQVPHLDEGFCSQSGGIFMRILAHALLSYEELLQWNNLSGNLKFKREWLLGRACIKEAVRQWVFQTRGEQLYPADIVVQHNELGAPYVTGWWNSGSDHALQVSLSHDKACSIAAVSDRVASLGVDREYIVEGKDYSFLEAAFHAEEQTLLNAVTANEKQEIALKIWCAKEAAAKFLKIGLQGAPEQFVVKFVNNNYDLAQVRYNDQLIQVSVVNESQVIMALAT